MKCLSIFSGENRSNPVYLEKEDKCHQFVICLNSPWGDCLVTSTTFCTPDI